MLRRLIATALTAGLVLAATLAAAAGAPHAIDLDRFDAGRRFVSLPNGQRIAYVERGDPHGQPVVLIHGYTDSARDWVPLIPYLDAHDRLIVVDLRGHGRSSRPECCYTRFDFAYDIRLLVDALRIRRVDLVGHSLGSIVAQVYAELWPERTGRVVLISSTAGPRAGVPAPPPAFDFAAEIRKLHEPLDPDSPFMIDWWSSPTPVDADFIRRQRRDAAAIPLRVWLAVLDQGLSGQDLRGLLPRLTAPTLLVWGSEDPIFGADARAGLREALPAAQVEVFEGLGHNPFWEKPADVAGVVNRFLDRGR